MSEPSDDVKAYRDWLIHTSHLMSEQLDKAIVVLAGGALGLSLTLMRPEATGKPVHSALLLGLSWLALAVALVLGLLSLLAGRCALEKAIDQVDQNRIYVQRPGGVYTVVARILEFVAVLLVAAGIIGLAVFAWLNVGRIA